MNVVAVVPSAGVGRRLKSKGHKSFLPLAGEPMLIRTLKALEDSPSVEGIVAVVHRQDVRRVTGLIRRFRVRKVIRVIPGGDSRTESVFRGIQALPKEARWVVVHDGARPLVSPDLMEQTLRAAYRWRAAIAAVPVIPTIKEGQNGWVKGTLNRDHLWAVQTPQVFRRDLLEEAHQRARRQKVTATDDAALVEAMGIKVRIVPGSLRNVKVTTREDWVIAQALLKDDANRNRV